MFTVLAELRQFLHVRFWEAKGRSIGRGRGREGILLGLCGLGGSGGGDSRGSNGSSGGRFGGIHC